MIPCYSRLKSCKKSSLKLYYPYPVRASIFNSLTLYYIIQVGLFKFNSFIASLDVGYSLKGVHGVIFEPSDFTCFSPDLP